MLAVVDSLARCPDADRRMRGHPRRRGARRRSHGIRRPPERIQPPAQPNHRRQSQPWNFAWKKIIYAETAGTHSVAYFAIGKETLIVHPSHSPASKQALAQALRQHAQLFRNRQSNALSENVIIVRRDLFQKTPINCDQHPQAGLAVLTDQRNQLFAGAIISHAPDRLPRQAPAAGARRSGAARSPATRPHCSKSSSGR